MFIPVTVRSYYILARLSLPYNWPVAAMKCHTLRSHGPSQERRKSQPQFCAGKRVERCKMFSLKLDLEREASDIYRYVVSRASGYSVEVDRGLGGSGPIQMVCAGYEFDQSGWFVLVFDRRPDAAHDGEWTRCIDENLLARPHWVRAGILGGKEFSESLGRMIISVLERANEEGAFADLPRADGFRLGLEEFNGSFGWDSSMH
jgi:hypothetical protein